IRDSESDEKIVLVCTHGAYDSCCGKFGVPVYNEIKKNNEISTWSTTHVGAHRFSANLVMLPEGIYYGRVNTENINNLIDSHLKEKIFLDCFRGRSCFSQTSQVSDYFLREKIGTLGIYDIKWEFEKDRDTYTAVEFNVLSENLVYSINSIVLNDAIKVLPSCGDNEARYLPLFYFYSLIPYTPIIKDNKS
ncbi:MAG: sucrase ferredoxin, partial [Thermodesulfobacteriota bacterium]